jgi:uncharacterized protein (DUF2345 family)
MTLEEIKAAVDAGKVVHWASGLYQVKKTGKRYDVVCSQNGSAIGLTWQDGKTMNGEPEEFYIASANHNPDDPK